MQSMRRSAVILSTLSAGALAADQQLRGSSNGGDNGNNKCLQNPQGDWTHPQGWNNDCSWMQCDGNGHNGDDCQHTDDSANQCRDWNLHLGNRDVCNIPAGNGHGKIFCFGDIRDHWENGVKINDCQWLKTSGDECGTDDNAQWCRDNNRDACPRQCPYGALTVTAPAALLVSKQAGNNGNNKCLQNPQGDWTHPQGWNNDCSWMQCDGNGHNGDDCQHTDDSANQCRDWNLHLGNRDVCSIPAGNGHGKIFCFGDIRDHWENGVKINDCQWLKTNGDECGTDDNAQWCRDNNRDACPRQCPYGALTVTAPAALPVSKQAGNLTVELASDDGCCSFDGCETCAQWCTQQGKEVCLAPQGAPGGGCDNSHSDPHAHPPQWCPTGAGAKVPAALTANDALAAAASTTCGALPQCVALSQTQPSQCPDAGSGNCKVNSAKMCIYNPKCVSGETSLDCVVDTGCQYVDTPSAACYGNGDFKNNDCGNSQFGCYPSKGCSDGTLSEQCAAGGQPQECRYCDKGGSPSAPGLVPCPAPAPAPVQLQSP